MTRETLDQQIERLKARWKNAFDREFVALLSLQMKDLSNEEFVEIVSFFIGNRPVSKPPLLQDFQDARIRTQKRTLERVMGSVGANPDIRNWVLRPWQAGLASYLEKEYPGCRSLKEAVELHLEKERIAKALGDS